MRCGYECMNGQSNATLLVLKMEEERHEPRNVGHLQKPEKARKQTPPYSFQKEMLP